MNHNLDNKDVLKVKTLKVVVVGESGVGKSSLLVRFSENKYYETRETIGIDIKTKKIIIDNICVKMEIWDTAGQERFKSISKSYFNKAEAVLFVFDLSNLDSFLQLFDRWIKNRNIDFDNHKFHVLIGTKSDLKNRQVSYEYAKKMADQFNLTYFEVSAKEDNGVDKPFMYLALEFLHNFPTSSNSPPILDFIQNPISISLTEHTPLVSHNKRRCC